MTSLRETVAMGAAGSDHVVTPELTRRGDRAAVGSQGRPLVESSNPTHLGSLHSTFVTFPHGYTPWSRGGSGVSTGCLNGGFPPRFGTLGACGAED